MHGTAVRPQLHYTTQVGIGPLAMDTFVELQQGRGSSRQLCGAPMRREYGLRHEVNAIAWSTAVLR